MLSFINFFSLLVFLIFTAFVSVGNKFVLTIDSTVNEKFISLSNTPSGVSSFLKYLAEFISFMSDKYVIILISLIFLLYIFSKRKIQKKDPLYRSLLVFYVFTVFGGVVLGLVLKYMIGRERPIDSLVQVSGYSFPSGHALVSTLVFGSLAYIIFKIYERGHKHARILITVFSILPIPVILSRLYLGVHWLSDVIAGLFLGIWIITTVIFMLERRR